MALPDALKRDLDALCASHTGSVKATPFREDSLLMHDPTKATPALVSGVYWVASELVTDIMRESLRMKPEAGLQPMPSWSILVPHPAKRHVGVPKFYGMSVFGVPSKDIRKDGVEAHYVFNPTLRPEQEYGVVRTMDVISKWGGAFFVADCGFGKTVCMASIIHRVQRKAMIVVPRITLLEQLSSNIPGMLGCKIGTLQGTQSEDALKALSECDVLLVSLDSLGQVAYPQAFLDQYGLVIFDEAHHMAARTLSTILPRVLAKRIVGFSATPDRRDGLEHALYWLLGPVAFVYQRLPHITGASETVHVKLVRPSVTIPDKVLYNGTLNFSGMVTALTESDVRNDFLISLALDAVKDRKKILMITALREHVEVLGTLLSGTDHEAVHGGMSTKDRARASVPTKILVATYGMLEEGFDDPLIDTLILCTPRSRVQQTIGRAERTALGKLKPMVYDVVDSNHIFEAMSVKRVAFYKTRGFKVEGGKPLAVFEPDGVVIN